MAHQDPRDLVDGAQGRGYARRVSLALPAWLGKPVVPLGRRRADRGGRRAGRGHHGRRRGGGWPAAAGGALRRCGGRAAAGPPALALCGAGRDPAGRGQLARERRLPASAARRALHDRLDALVGGDNRRRRRRRRNRLRLQACGRAGPQYGGGPRPLPVCVVRRRPRALHRQPAHQHGSNARARRAPGPRARAACRAGCRRRARAHRAGAPRRRRAQRQPDRRPGAGARRDRPRRPRHRGHHRDRRPRPPGDGRDAPHAQAAAGERGRGGPARPAAGTGRSRRAAGAGARGRAAGAACRRGRAAPVVAERRPVGLSDRPGGPDQRRQARRPSRHDASRWATGPTGSSSPSPTAATRR